MTVVLGPLLVSGAFLASLAAAPTPVESARVPAAPSVFFALQPGAPAKSQIEQLRTGKWKTVGVQQGATAMPPAVVAQVMPGEMTFGEEKIVVTLQGRNVGEVPYSVDESASPAKLTIDGALVANAPPAKRAKSTVIFRVEGDKLEICVGKVPDQPPADFAPDAENGWTLITYQRTK